MKLCDKIKRKRQELKISQEQIAFDLQIDQSGYSKVERGLVEPGAAVLAKILNYLKLKKE